MADADVVEDVVRVRLQFAEIVARTFQQTEHLVEKSHDPTRRRPSEPLLVCHQFKEPRQRREQRGVGARRRWVLPFRPSPPRAPVQPLKDRAIFRRRRSTPARLVATSCHLPAEGPFHSGQNAFVSRPKHRLERRPRTPDQRMPVVGGDAPAIKVQNCRLQDRSVR